DEEWTCYVEANRAYAKMVHEIGGATDTWIQDFHLLLVARELRRLGHHGRVGLYLHVPFPPVDVFETLPWASEIVAAMLEYGRVGMQTQRWADNFIASARGLLGTDAEGRARDRVRAIPVGIDPDRWAAAAAAGGDPNESQSLEATSAGRKLILGVDRLDYSKG